MENFVVSARKYRPTTFASVVGQRHITSTLKNAIERGQLAHAYLFCGPRGVGKTTCARIFAKTINCLNPQSGEACNECESCRTFNEGRSLNVHELDAASNNSVDDIRNLIEQVRIIPQQGRYSVYVIDEVHMLTPAAFNAFLKTLEEPPRHAIFILATTEKHKIIPTILSRCQIYDFNRIRVEDGVEYLRHIASQEGVEADDEALNLIAHKADGAMRDALSMFDRAVSFSGTKLNYKDVASTLNVLDYDTYFSVTELLLAGNYVDALLRFDEVLSRGFSPQVFISGLNAHFRDLLMAQGPAITLVEFTGRLIERYKEQAARCDRGFLFSAISLLTEADGKIRQSSNQRLLVELGLMKLAGLGQKKNGAIDSDTFVTSFALPELVTTAPSPQPAPMPQQAAPQSTRVEATPTVERPNPAADATPEPKAKGAIATKSEGQMGTTTNDSRPKSNRSYATLRQAVTKISLSGVLEGDFKSATEIQEEAESEAARMAANIDPMCEEKITAAHEKIVESLLTTRPRLGRVFENMTVEGNRVRTTVASQALYEEVMREKSELQKIFSTISGATGLIEIEVEVNERVKVSRPITLEDRLRHLVARNERLSEMISELGLDAE